MKSEARPGFWNDTAESKSQKAARLYDMEYAHEIHAYEDTLKTLNDYFLKGERVNGQLPKIKDLRAEMKSLYAEKNAVYVKRAGLKAEYDELSVAKRNVGAVARGSKCAWEKWGEIGG